MLVGGLELVFSQKYWVAIIIPIDEFFQRGGPTTNQTKFV